MVATAVRAFAEHTEGVVVIAAAVRASAEHSVLVVEVAVAVAVADEHTARVVMVCHSGNDLFLGVINKFPIVSNVLLTEEVASEPAAVGGASLRSTRTRRWPR